MQFLNDKRVEQRNYKAMSDLSWLCWDCFLDSQEPEQKVRAIAVRALLNNWIVPEYGPIFQPVEEIATCKGKIISSLSGKK